MFKSITNIFSSLGSIFSKKGSSSSASATGVGGTNEKKSFFGKLIAKVSTGIIDSLSKYSVQQEEVVGVDIGPSGIRLLQLTQTEKEEWIVEKLTARHVDRVEDIKVSQGPFVEAIKIGLESGKFTTTNAAVSLPVSSSIVKVIAMPLMSDLEMKNAIEFNSLWENLTQLPGTIDEYSIFHQVIRKDSSSNMMDVLFVASKLSDVNAYIDIVTQAGLQPVVLDVKCFALRNAFETMALPNIAQKPMAILEIGSHENYLLVLKGDDPFVSDLFLSNADKAVLGVKQNDTLALAPIIDRYILQIRQNLTAYQNRFKSDKVDSIFIVTDTPNSEMINKVLSEKLSDLTVVNFNPFSKMQIPANVQAKIDAEENNSSFAAVTGLATRKLDIFGYYQKVTGVKNINLLPNREGVKSSIKSKFISGIFAIGISIAVVVFGIYAFSSYYFQSSSNQDALSDYDMLKMEIEQLQGQYSALISEKDKINEQLKLSETATTNQNIAAKVLREIAYQAGFNIVLTNLDFNGQEKYEVKGEALSDADVIKYITRVKETGLFENVVLEKSSLAQEGSTIKKFVVKLIIKPELINSQLVEVNEEAEE
ncbi:MAG: pilus assembly protein PilM [Candidatus Pelagibacterales bacterium]